MTWNVYRISLRLLSPLHIGWRKLGNLQQTRSYATGRNIWGALTERLARDSGSDYTSTGNQVDEQLAFTYFYPSTMPDMVSLWPWDDEDEFQWTFIGSYSSTALNNRAAEEGSLHETEYIAPYTRHGKSVYLVGYIFEREDCQLRWRDALKRLRIGGERGYGWGRLTVEGEPQGNQQECFNYKCDCTGDRPLIEVPKDKPLLAHTRANHVNDKGFIEPLVGRVTETTTGRFGKNLCMAEICWAPGTITSNEGKFIISEKGLWLKE